VMHVQEGSQRTMPCLVCIKAIYIRLWQCKALLLDDAEPCNGWETSQAALHPW